MLLHMHPIPSGHLIRQFPRPRRAHRALAAFLMIPLLLTAGCGNADQGDAADLVVVDTLPGGALVVRNPAEGVWDRRPAKRWSLTEAYRIGRVEGDGPDVFGQISGLVEDPLGRLWVADAHAAEIRVFDQQGRHVRTIGGRGEGPGEFQRPAVLLRGPDDNIWISDGLLLRWEIFDSAGVRVAGHPEKGTLGGGIRFWTPDHRLLEASVRVSQGPQGLITHSVYQARRLEREGTLVDVDSVPSPDLPEPPRVDFRQPGTQGYRIRTTLPLAARPRAVPGPDGHYWLSDGGPVYAIRRQTVDGDALMIMGRAYAQVPVSEAARQEAAEALLPPEGMISDDNAASRLPSVHAPFEDFFPATDTSLWVRRTVEGGQQFEVFDSQGRFLGAPEYAGDAAALSPRLITRDRIYAVVEDDLGVQSIVVLQIDRT